MILVSYSPIKGNFQERPEKKNIVFMTLSEFLKALEERENLKQIV